MKRLVFAALATLMFIAPAVIFYVNNARIKTHNVIIKHGSGSLTVRPAVVVIKPQ